MRIDTTFTFVGLSIVLTGLIGFFVSVLCSLPAGAQEESIQAYKNSVRRAPRSDVAHYCLANALYKAGLTREAQDEYRTAFGLTRSEQMRAFCQQMLSRMGAPIAGSMSAAGYKVSNPTWMPQATNGPLERFQKMATTRGAADRECDSAVGGPVAYDKAPGAEFDSWIAEFRIRFGKMVNYELYRRGYRAMAGRTEMIFSVDNRHRLRGRILRSTAAPYLTDCLLAATRDLDGASVLDFPRSGNLDGFNFSMAWVYPERPWNEVYARMRQSDLSGTVLAKGKRAAAAGLGTGAVPTARDAVGKIISSDAKMVGAEQLQGLSISTDVAGLIMPRKKPLELKAPPAKSLR